MCLAALPGFGLSGPVALQYGHKHRGPISSTDSRIFQGHPKDLDELHFASWRGRQAGHSSLVVLYELVTYKTGSGEIDCTHLDQVSLGQTRHQMQTGYQQKREHPAVDLLD